MKKYIVIPAGYLFCFALLFCGSYFSSMGYPWQLNIVLSAVVALLAWYKVYGYRGNTGSHQNDKNLEPIIYLLSLSYPMFLVGVSDWLLEKAIISFIFWCVLFIASRESRRQGAEAFDILCALVPPGLLCLAYKWPYSLIVCTGMLLGWVSYSSNENR